MIAHRPFGGTAFCRRRAGSGQVEDACENASVIEIVRESTSPVPPRVAIFDFDGTLSLIRSGWIDIMVPLCVEQLQAINTGESETELRAIVDEFTREGHGTLSTPQVTHLYANRRDTRGVSITRQQLYLG